VDRTAVVGFRVSERVAGRGVATSALQELCRIAREQYGLRLLRAAASNENIASQNVLAEAGFVATTRPPPSR
jgi:ribosomal-protein-alanine N-acetyltransferase